MATRKFNDIEYPVPGIDTAIRTLRPYARWALSGNQTFTAWEDATGTLYERSELGTAGTSVLFK